MNRYILSHLQQLENESIHLIREAVAELSNLALLYSIDKASSVMLRLVQKAFYPGKIPFPLLHINTTYQFREMIAFRDSLSRDMGIEVLEWINPEGLKNNVNPFDYERDHYTRIMQIEALEQALQHYGFDRVFCANHHLDPPIGGKAIVGKKSSGSSDHDPVYQKSHKKSAKNQPPQFWNLYHQPYHPLGRHNGVAQISVLSNWTELDLWFYIYFEKIPLVSLYFAKQRPLIERNGLLIMVDDERLPLIAGEVAQIKKVRFPQLSCYPLCGAVESDAETPAEIIKTKLNSRETP